MRFHSAAAALLLVALLSQSPPVHSQADGVECSSLPFTACLLNLGCIYDAIKGSCETYTATQLPAPSTDDVVDTDVFAFSYEDFMSTGMGASPPMMDVAD